ncbi:hypothetical protein Fmac_005954 [Flemingia macrophylla]|uniref:Uncharacterized protein n=1 Tax=Flemingia macrophylla TaxID=520843 RepID=A0ABD1N9D3_9FABA
MNKMRSEMNHGDKRRGRRLKLCRGRRRPATLALSAGLSAQRQSHSDSSAQHQDLGNANNESIHCPGLCDVVTVQFHRPLWCCNGEVEYLRTGMCGVVTVRRISLCGVVTMWPLEVVSKGLDEVMMMAHMVPRVEDWEVSLIV